MDEGEEEVEEEEQGGEEEHNVSFLVLLNGYIGPGNEASFQAGTTVIFIVWCTFITNSEH